MGNLSAGTNRSTGHVELKTILYAYSSIIFLVFFIANIVCWPHYGFKRDCELSFLILFYSKM